MTLPSALENIRSHYSLSLSYISLHLRFIMMTVLKISSFWDVGLIQKSIILYEYNAESEFSSCLANKRQFETTSEVESRRCWHRTRFCNSNRNRLWFLYDQDLSVWQHSSKLLQREIISSSLHSPIVLTILNHFSIELSYKLNDQNQVLLWQTCLFVKGIIASEPY